MKTKKVLSFALRLIGAIAIAYAIAMLILMFFSLSIGSSSLTPTIFAVLIAGIVINKIGNHIKDTN